MVKREVYLRGRGRARRKLLVLVHIFSAGFISGARSADGLATKKSDIRMCMCVCLFVWCLMCGGGWQKKCGLRTIQWLEKDGDGRVEQGVCGFSKYGDISLRIGEKKFEIRMSIRMPVVKSMQKDQLLM